jgi:nitrogen-specific signal transduction histidine kinase
MNFSRLEEHEDMNHKGTGLGLSICKSLVEQMGGSVTVESELGHGTTFIVCLKTKCNYIPLKSSKMQSMRNLRLDQSAMQTNNQPLKNNYSCELFRKNFSI